MGNRALITLQPLTKENNVIAVYVHWNGGIESVKAICEVCKARGFRDPTGDNSYALARFIGVWHEFFGVTSSLSLGVYTTDLESLKDAWLDNGVYTVGKDWEIIEHFKVDENGKKIDLGLEVPKSQLERYEGIKNAMIKFGEKVAKIEL